MWTLHNLNTLLIFISIIIINFVELGTSLPAVWPHQPSSLGGYKEPPIKYEPLTLSTSDRIGIMGQTIHLPCAVHWNSHAHGHVLYQWVRGEDGEEINNLAWSGIRILKAMIRYDAKNDRILEHRPETTKSNHQEFSFLDSTSSDTKTLNWINVNESDHIGINSHEKPFQNGISPFENDWIHTVEINQLVIKSAHPSDSGLYTCRVFNGFGHIEMAYNLMIVKGEGLQLNDNDEMVKKEKAIDKFSNTLAGSYPTFRPQAVKPPSIDSVVEGGTENEIFEIASGVEGKKHIEIIIRHLRNDVVIKCPPVYGVPRPLLTWYKNGERLWSESTTNENHDINLVNNNDGEKVQKVQKNSLTIYDLNLLDEGFYTCVMSNAFGSVNETFFLEIVDQIRGPKLIGEHPINESVLEGQSAQFRCDVRSELKPHIQWLKRLPNLDISTMASNALLNMGGYIDGASLESLNVENIEQSMPYFHKIGERDANSVKIEGHYLLNSDDIDGNKDQNSNDLNVQSDEKVIKTEVPVILKLGKHRYEVIKNGPQYITKKSWLGPSGKYTSMLSMESSRSKAGYYVCMVTNAVGFDYRGSYLNVLTPTEYETNELLHLNGISHKNYDNNSPNVHYHNTLDGGQNGFTSNLINGGDSAFSIQPIMSATIFNEKPTLASIAHLSGPALIAVPILSLALIILVIFTLKSVTSRNTFMQRDCDNFGQTNRLSRPSWFKLCFPCCIGSKDEKYGKKSRKIFNAPNTNNIGSNAKPNLCYPMNEAQYMQVLLHKTGNMSNTTDVIYDEPNLPPLVNPHQNFQQMSLYPCPKRSFSMASFTNTLKDWLKCQSFSTKQRHINGKNNHNSNLTKISNVSKLNNTQNTSNKEENQTKNSKASRGQTQTNLNSTTYTFLTDGGKGSDQLNLNGNLEAIVEKQIPLSQNSMITPHSNPNGMPHVIKVLTTNHPQYHIQEPQQTINFNPNERNSRNVPYNSQNSIKICFPDVNASKSYGLNQYPQNNETCQHHTNNGRPSNYLTTSDEDEIEESCVNASQNYDNGMYSIHPPSMYEQFQNVIPTQPNAVNGQNQNTNHNINGHKYLCNPAYEQNTSSTLSSRSRGEDRNISGDGTGTQISSCLSSNKTADINTSTSSDIRKNRDVSQNKYYESYNNQFSSFITESDDVPNNSNISGEKMRYLDPNLANQLHMSYNSDFFIPMPPYPKELFETSGHGEENHSFEILSKKSSNNSGIHKHQIIRESIPNSVETSEPNLTYSQGKIGPRPILPNACKNVANNQMVHQNNSNYNYTPNNNNNLDRNKTSGYFVYL